MKYLNENDLHRMGIPWQELLNVVEECTLLLADKDYAQPVKPYLRYHDLRNRIIAMPAFVGGNIQSAGIKWIASFPGNLIKQLPRAHAVVVLNDATTGQPLAFINTALLSGIRTAAVTGFAIRQYLRGDLHPQQRLCFGIIGFGPIGQLHLRMLLEHFGDAISDIFLYDLRGISPADIAPYQGFFAQVHIAGGWEEVFSNADIFITCTVSANRYINRMPEKGKLYLNVSLRDFEPAFLQAVDVMVVDDWEEVCRENTDIEVAMKQGYVSEAGVLSIAQITGDSRFSRQSEHSVMFNPMGMAIFDIAVARFYYERSHKEAIGISLPD